MSDLKTVSQWEGLGVRGQQANKLDRTLNSIAT